MLIRDPDYFSVQFGLITVFGTFIPQIITLNLRANTSRFKNRLELFNEWILGTSLISICVFTNMSKDLTIRYEFGWYVCAFVLFGILVNIIIILYKAIKHVRSLFRRQYTLWTHQTRMSMMPQYF